MKPYQHIPILECQEPLIAIPTELFALEDPHPYIKLGAPYGDRSPYFLRQQVLERLIAAQASLQQQHPGWHIQIFDAYRPLAVQQFMVDYTFAAVVRTQGRQPQQLTDAQRQVILSQVYEFWAIPSIDPATPPPHSTGAAVDITLVDADGRAVDMGSAIDELSPRSYPDYFAPDSMQMHLAIDAAKLLPSALTQIFHQNRQLLRAVMVKAGFCQHPREWWHFSWGDQLWAWQMTNTTPDIPRVACYGAMEHMYTNRG